MFNLHSNFLQDISEGYGENLSSWIQGTETQIEIAYGQKMELIHFHPLGSSTGVLTAPAETSRSSGDVTHACISAPASVCCLHSWVGFPYGGIDMDPSSYRIWWFFMPVISERDLSLSHQFYQPPGTNSSCHVWEMSALLLWKVGYVKCIVPPK